MATLQLRQERRGDALHVSLEGQMDEDAPYHSLGLAGIRHLVFDGESITLINSTGLQKWVRFLEGLPMGLSLTFVRCSVRMISQVNMFSGFFAQRAVTITSFFAPYYCVPCDKSHIHLIDVQKNADDLRHERAPSHACPHCNGAMEFDGLEKKYFLFVRSMGLLKG